MISFIRTHFANAVRIGRTYSVHKIIFKAHHGIETNESLIKL